MTGYSHGNYIINLLNNQLPQENLGQFYHPPFYYFVSSLIIKFVSIFVQTNSLSAALEAAKIVSCFASCAIVMMTKSICSLLQIGRKGTIVSVSFVAFIPQFYLLAGRVNNDSLVTFFMVLIVLYMIRWYQQPTIHNIVILGLGFGLGMMTKISASVLVFVCAPMMLIKFVEMFKEKQYKLLGKSIGVFSIISFPLGLWYLFRNYVKFHQSFFYVLEQEKYGVIYVGNYNIFDRFLKIDFMKIFSQLYNRQYDDYNVPTYLLKGGLFGEFYMKIPKILTISLIAVWVVMILLLFVATIFVIIKENKNMFLRLMMPAIVLISFGSYIVFNIKLPYGCSMDFRYITLIPVIQAILLGDAYELAKSREEKNKVFSVMIKGGVVILVIFSIMSVLSYCMLQR